MKLLAVLSTTVYSSHYRGGSYIFKVNADGTTSIKQTQTWRDGMAGTPNTCTKAFEGYQANNYIETNCIQSDGNACPTFNLEWPYIVGFSSDQQLGGNNDYCYGSYDQSMTTPATGYKFGFSATNWVAMTDDKGVKRSEGPMEVYAAIYDPNNNSPVFTHPPLWRVMSGCDGQVMVLNPMDPDGDTVRCRWATTPEEGGAARYDATAWPSLSLDGDNCIVHYTGSMDGTHEGLKGVAIMMEDFDQNGVRKSSIPVQFLAAVWTPNSSARGVDVPFVYPDWYAEADDDHHHDHTNEPKNGKKRVRRTTTRVRRTTTPSYCSAVPVIVPPSPADGSIIITDESFEITIRAESDGGFIKSYSYEKPALMSCTSPDQNGSVTCSWTPTEADKKTGDHGFCFLATDSLGLTTERRCTTLRVLKCLEGFEYINGTCVDIDECTEKSHSCDINATCDNTDGGYDCTCNDGWNGNGSACVDIDECATDAHACHEFGFCTNTPGSYGCTCNDGYMGDGFLCTVPCATFYDTAPDGFLHNKSAFTTGTFDVSNLETFATVPSQTGVSNWKPSTGFNNKASFVTVQPKCKMEGFSGMNFQGKKLGEWNGRFFSVSRCVRTTQKPRENRLSLIIIF